MKVENVQNSQTQTKKIRAIIPIYYSTTTNTSKKTAFMLQQKLEQSSFICNVMNVGDIDKDKFVESSGVSIFLISTYGNGTSPTDGQEFIKWISSGVLLQNIQFAIMGFGNKTFQHFCKNATNLRNLLLNNKAQQFLQMLLCNAAVKQESVNQKFEQWSNKLLEKLQKKYDLKQMQIGKFQPDTTMIISDENINDSAWRSNQRYWNENLGKQFLTYQQATTVEVIQIKQLRKQDDGRSTLLIRLKKPQNIQFEPGCNINIYPQNVRNENEKQLKGSFKIQKNNSKTIKIPYPPMNLQTLWKLSNFHQIADKTLIKYALSLSNANEQIKNKYINNLKQPNYFQTNKINCWKVYQELQPSYQFIVKLGMNQVRPYTVASWNIQEEYFDIIASIQRGGLASNYFNSQPKTMKIKMFSSSFYVSERKPLIMIANGVGIAPFRSLVQYFLNNPQLQMPQMHLFYGIRDKEIDYYFEQEWEKLQKLGKVTIHIAQSRIDPQKKVYVQNLLAQNRQLLTKHIFDKKGLVFICGSASMAQGVSDEIYQVVKKQQKVPFKAYKIFNQLYKNKTIVQQVFN